MFHVPFQAPCWKREGFFFFFRKKKQAQKSIKEELLLGALCF